MQNNKCSGVKAHSLAPLISEEMIANRVQELASQINIDYQDKDLVVIALLRGAFMFVADLSRLISLPHAIDFMAVSSYENATISSGRLQMKLDSSLDIENKDILLIDDIIDTGYTVHEVKNRLLQRNVNSLSVCTLLDKPSRRKVEIEADYVGFIIPDVFVVGYGIDYAQCYRHLPYLGKVILQDEC